VEEEWFEVWWWFGAVSTLDDETWERKEPMMGGIASLGRGYSF
jgi:hypothetical protein